MLVIRSKFKSANEISHAEDCEDYSGSNAEPKYVNQDLNTLPFLYILQAAFTTSEIGVVIDCIIVAFFLISD